MEDHVHDESIGKPLYIEYFQYGRKETSALHCQPNQMAGPTWPPLPRWYGPHDGPTARYRFAFGGSHKRRSVPFTCFWNVHQRKGIKANPQHDTDNLHLVHRELAVQWEWIPRVVQNSLSGSSNAQETWTVFYPIKISNFEVLSCFT